MKHVTSLFDISANDIDQIFALTKDLKSRLAQGKRDPVLPGRVVALLFEKQSLRTRVSFEAGVTQLGGSCLYLGSDVGWKSRESIEDFSRVLTQYVDVLVCRAKSQETVEELSKYASCSVINGLTDLYHPCQALTDLYTLRELHGSLHDRKLAYIGDCNNVARSLAIICGKLGIALSIAAPEGYRFDDEFLSLLKEQRLDLQLTMTADPREAVADASGVYTDVWVSMGQEDESKERRAAFADYQVNASLMQAAPMDACFLHCLPAHRGLEVTDEVMDGPRSVVIQQAGNRMHVQKGLTCWLLNATL